MIGRLLLKEMAKVSHGGLGEGPGFPTKVRRQVRQQQALPTIGSYMKLYTSLQTSKCLWQWLARVRGASVHHFLSSFTIFYHLLSSFIIFLVLILVQKGYTTKGWGVKSVCVVVPPPFQSLVDENLYSGNHGTQRCVEERLSWKVNCLVRVRHEKPVV